MNSGVEESAETTMTPADESGMFKMATTSLMISMVMAQMTLIANIRCYCDVVDVTDGDVMMTMATIIIT